MIKVKPLKEFNPVDEVYLETFDFMQPKKVFISYSHKDEQFKDDLIEHLSPLMRQGRISSWTDRQIEAGTSWRKEIDENLADSDIILLIISSSFIASDYCYDVEVGKALEMHKNSMAAVIPIIARPCKWIGLPFSELQALPKDGKPIIEFANTDSAYLNIVDGIFPKLNKVSSVTLESIPAHQIHHEKVFSSDAIVCLLPRSYVILSGLEYEENPSWHITAYSYSYLGKQIHGTHYNSYYEKNWRNEKDRGFQCQKLCIPQADWDYAEDILFLMMDIRKRGREETIEQVIEFCDSEVFHYFQKGSEFNLPMMPAHLEQLERNAPIRDILFQLNEISFGWEGNGSSEITKLIRQAHLVIFKMLGKEHPLLQYFDQLNVNFENRRISDGYGKWVEELRQLLNEAIEQVA